MNMHVLSFAGGIAALCFAALQTTQAPVASQVPGLAAPVRLECDKGVIDSGAYIAHSGPLFADLDGDNKPELLVGNFKGNFQLYANVGEAGKPKFVAKGLLQAEGKDALVKNW